MKKILLATVSIVGAAFLGQSLHAFAMPSTNKVIAVSDDVSELLYEDTENGKSHIVRLYYVPKDTVLDRTFGTANWSYVAQPGRTAAVSFGIRFSPSVALKDHMYRISEQVAYRYQSYPEYVQFIPLPAFESKVWVFKDDDSFIRKDTPSDNTPVDGIFHFNFELNRQGTKWFRENIVEHGQLIGQLTTKVKMYDEVMGEAVTMDFSHAITLKEVPYCAVVANPCKF